MRKTITIVPGALALAIVNALAIAAPADDAAADPNQAEVAQADQGPAFDRDRFAAEVGDHHALARAPAPPVVGAYRG